MNESTEHRRSLNWKEIDLILSELHLSSGKVQTVLQPEFSTLYFGIYAERRVQHLYIYLAPNEVRLHLKQRAAKKPAKAQRFQQLLQSRLVGATLQEIQHLDHNRILRFRFTKHRMQQVQEAEDAAPEQEEAQRKHTTLLLYVRLWSSTANVLLCTEHNIIIDALYRKPKQHLLPKHAFHPPPPAPEKRKPVQIRPWHTLTENSETPFNEFIDTYYRNKKREQRMDQQISNLQQILEKQKRHFTQIQTQCSKQVQQYSQYEQSLHIGNEILSHLDTIKPRQEWFDCRSADNKEVLHVHLDTTQSPVQNAEIYFQQYKKSQKQLKQFQSRLAEAVAQLGNIEKAERLTEQFEQELHSNDVHSQKQDTSSLIHQISKLLKIPTEKFALEKPATRKGSDKKGSSELGLRIQAGTYLYMIGRNAKENDGLLRRAARGKDVWMHVRGKAGAYVFIRALNKNSIPLDTLLLAGQLAALFSKVPNGNTVELHYTEVKHLRVLRGKLGLVTVQRDKNLSITVDTQISKQFLETNRQRMDGTSSSPNISRHTH